MSYFIYERKQSEKIKVVKANSIMNPDFGKVIIYVGLGLVLIGGFIWLFGGKLTWLGQLPGDINIKKENFSLHFPITTMIIISILLSLIFNLIKKIF